MILNRYLALFLAALWLTTVAAGAESIYKSVDTEGRVTYSSQPPGEAAATEAIRVAPPPSAEATDEAIKRTEETEKEVDARFNSLMESRQKKADERKAAQELKRREQEAAEQQRRYEEALRQSTEYYPVYRRHWPWPYPPHPPMHPPYPPRPTPLPNKPYRSHINPPARDW